MHAIGLKFSILLLVIFWSFQSQMIAQDHSHSDQVNNHSTSHTEDQEHGSPCAHHEGPYDPSAIAMHHIADANTLKLSFFFKEFNLPLPCMLYAPDHGWSFFSSGKFDIGHHGDGHKAIDKFVLNGGIVMRVADHSFPMGEVAVDGFAHTTEMVEGKKEDVNLVCFEGATYRLDKKSTLDGGLVGGGITSYYDFSLTRGVVLMFLVAVFLFWIFTTAARAYSKREGVAPSGLQNFIEPLFIFIQEEVAKPMIGKKYEKYMPFIMSLFFFILVLNLIGQIPFLGNPNITGNIAVTMVLAVFTFLITTFSGNKNYWQHIFWMPGIPWPVKLILTPIEVLGLILKPFTLLIRLFANMSAGHIVMLSFVGLIFILGDSGASVAGGWGGAVVSTILTIFMSAIELLVALIQAFIFAILSASYIGAAVEEHH